MSDAPKWQLGALITEFDSGDSLSNQEVQSAIRLSREVIAISYLGTGGVSTYDTVGRVLRKVGRRGGGPGEFQLLGLMRRLAPASVGVSDLILARLTVVSESGYVKTIVPVHVKGVAALGDCPLAGFFTDGSPVFAFVTQEVSPAALSNTVRDTARLLIFDPQGQNPRLVGAFPGSEYMVVEWKIANPPSKYKRIRRPFGVTTDFATVGNVVVVVDNEQPGFDIRDMGGRLVRSVRWDTERRLLSAERIARYQADILDGIDDSARRRAMSDELNSYPYPTSVPFFAEGSLFVDAVGRVWLRDYSSAGDGTVQYVIVDTAGSAIGTMRVPEDLSVTDAGANYVLAVARDARGSVARLYRY